MDAHPRVGRLQPRFYVMGNSLVFVFVTSHIPSVASSMMAGAVSLSLADVAYPAVLGGRVAGVGLLAGRAASTAAMGAGRWAIDRLRVHTSLHTGTDEPPRAQLPGEPATVTPPRPPEPDRGPGNSGSVRAACVPPVSRARDPGESGPDRDTPPRGQAEERDDRKKSPGIDT